MPTIRSPDPRGARAELGVVIPALDEARALPGLLDDLSRLTLPSRVVVVDGGSRDDTVRVARRGGAETLHSPPGRARQMNAGAAFLQTPWLLMVHADSRLDAAALRAAQDHVCAGGNGAAHAAYFDLAIDHPRFFYRLIEGGCRIRIRRTGLVYGDQALLIPRSLFESVGPYPDEPIMEDVILNLRLHRAGRLRPLPARLVTSPRRYEEKGRIRAWVRNATLITRFMRGASPARLARHYPPRRETRAVRGKRRGAGADVLLVFAKAPRPGSVKTRLAREIGDLAAAEAYRRMGRRVVDRVTPRGRGSADRRAGTPGSAAARRRPVQVVVCYAPFGAEAEVRSWLGRAPSDYWPQPEGDLGERMAAMFERAFRRAERVVVIGTDAPSVDLGAVRLALDALDDSDVVLGPAADGGYYLMGLSAPRPGLFEGVAWSTGAVLAQTVARARAAGLSVAYLEVRRDVDTAADLAGERSMLD